MSRKHRKSRRVGRMKKRLAVLGVVLVLVVGVLLATLLESRLAAPVENAGLRFTEYTSASVGAQIFMNGGWHVQKNLETLLVMGIDEQGTMQTSNSYNNSSQADFLALYMRNQDTGEINVIHLNRDTMTDVSVLGVTGDSAGTMYGQLALAFNFGRGEQDSCKNTVETVSNLLYGMEIDRYIAVTMDAVPIINDWMGGVELEILDDFSGIDDTLVAGEKILLQGEHALNYVRTRRGLDDSSNLHRMERQRQYAAAWLKQAKPCLADAEAVAALVMDMSDYHYSDCTVDELANFAENLSASSQIKVYELPGEAVLGDQFMEYYIDETEVQNLILDLFYTPVTS